MEGNKKPILIALGSKAGVGKDKTADYFQQQKKFRRISFAEDIYECCGSIQKILQKDVSKDRKLLRTIGQALKDVYGINVWVERVEKKIKDSIENGENIIITDLRFDVEWEMLKKYDFVKIRIEREDRVLPEDPFHISETQLDDKEWDLTIKNDGSLMDLEQKVINTLDLF